MNQKLRFLMLALLCAMLNVAWGADVTTTYTFTSNSWNATPANWVSVKNGTQLTSDRGVQITTNSTGANATSPIPFTNVSKVVVVYSTNADKGAGTIKVKVGDNEEKSFTVTKTGGTSDREAEFSLNPSESGKIKLTVNCTTNSIYIKSIAITVSDDPYINVSSTTIEAGYEGVTNGSLSFTHNKLNTGVNVVFYEADGTTKIDSEDEPKWFNGVASTETGILTYTISKNEGEARTLYFRLEALSTVSINDLIQSDLITVTQAAAPGKLSIPWEEDFSGDNPLSKYRYSDVSPESSQIYAGGAAPELMIKSKGYLTAIFDLEGYSGYLTLTFKSNHFEYLEVICICDDENEVTYNNVDGECLINVAEGTETLSLTVKNKSSKNARVDNFKLVKGKLQKPANLSYSKESFSAYIGGDNDFPVLSNENNLNVTYSSSNENIATIDSNGNITLVARGTTTITATSAETEDFLPGEASYTLIVGGVLTYQKVTSTEEITNGNYLIVCEEGNVAFDGSLETLDAANNKIGVTIVNNEITAPETAAFTIDVTNGTLKSYSGKYIGVLSNSNGLGTSDVATTYKNTFAINSGNAVIAADYSGSNMSLRYNPDANLFRYYKSTSGNVKNIQLYKEVTEEPADQPFTLKFNTLATDGKYYYATMGNIGNGNFVVPNGVTVYTVQVNENGKIQMEDYDPNTQGKVVIPGSEAYLLKSSTSGEYVFNPATEDDGEAITLGTNMLYPTVVDGLTARPLDVEEDVVILFYKLSLNKEGKNLGFYYGAADGAPFEGITPYSAYLAVPQESGSTTGGAILINFDEDADGIQGVSTTEQGSNEAYTLTGVCVKGNLPKGIYIINGRKQVVR